jgi:hypothetical protein
MLSQIRLTQYKTGKMSLSDNTKQPDESRLNGLLRSKL